MELPFPSKGNGGEVRFNDQARNVMQRAKDEAIGFNHEYIGTEHVLLGIVNEESSVAADILQNLGVSPGKVGREVETIVQPGPETVMLVRLPQTPRTKKAIEFAVEEARRTGHDLVGSEHILLGLLQESEGVAAQVLLNLGVSLRHVRQEVLRLLGHAADASQLDTAIQVPTAKLRPLPDVVRSTLAAFDQLFQHLQQVKQEALRSNDLEEAGYVSDLQDRLEKMRVCFARKWSR
jgi:ATP-dependent Clp protease ATP-binding subunit ClpA